MTDLSPLRHPLWWSALAVLIVNDHVLKGSGLVPSWLTGKLSGFAFLIVAPVLCAVLLRGHRLIILAAFAALYIAIELSSVCSIFVGRMLAAIGLRSGLWPDPSDLLALSILPCTFWLLREQTASSGARERVGLIIGSLACLATTAPEDHVHHPFFVNRSEGSQELRVSWLLRAVTCEGDLDALASTLGPGDLDEPASYSVLSGEVVVLDGPEGAGRSPVGECHLERAVSEQPTCVAAILQAGDGPAVLMRARPYWLESDDARWFACSRAPAPVSKCQPKLALSEDPGPDAVSFKDENFHAGTQVSIAPLDLTVVAAREPAADGCKALLTRYLALQTSSRCSTNQDCSVVAALDLPDADGECHDLYLASEAADEVESLRSDWQSRCIVKKASGCSRQRHPAVCTDGACQELCPGRELPTCPERCDQTLRDISLAELCAYKVSCLDDAGVTCHCDHDALKCEPSASCDTACIPRPAADGGAGHAAP